jgi:RNA ligase
VNPLLTDLFPQADLDTALSEGWVRAQHHPELPLCILNYTAAAQGARHWTPVTEQCRGLIYDTTTGRVVARPFRKFHNYGSPQAGMLDLSATVTSLDKADGSLGILYPTGRGTWAVATRGSFTSDQALHATRVWEERYAAAGVSPYEGETWLFEVIYPENRIVLDYGRMDDLVLLGAVANHTGRVISPSSLYRWTGPRVQEFDHVTLAQAVAAPPRPNAEGLVVRFEDGRMVKLKQADYLDLHRIITEITERTVWEYVAVNACAHLISEPKHWGSRLRIDPARAAEVLAEGPGWMAALLDNTPDEFHGWLRNTFFDLHTKASTLSAAIEVEAVRVRGIHGDDRASIFRELAEHPHRGAVMLAYDDRRAETTTYVWDSVKPEPVKPWAAGAGVAA